MPRRKRSSASRQFDEQVSSERFPGNAAPGKSSDPGLRRRCRLAGRIEHAETEHRIVDEAGHELLEMDLIHHGRHVGNRRAAYASPRWIGVECKVRDHTHLEGVISHGRDHRAIVDTYETSKEVAVVDANDDLAQRRNFDDVTNHDPQHRNRYVPTLRAYLVFPGRCLQRFFEVAGGRSKIFRFSSSTRETASSRRTYALGSLRSDGAKLNSG